MTHPEALFGQPVEATVFDPGNEYVLAPHLCAAAQELPLTETDLELFGPTARGVLDRLAAASRLRKRPRGWFWTDRLPRLRPGRHPLHRRRAGRAGGVRDRAGHRPRRRRRARTRTAHAGAVYVHRGDTWLVESLDLDDHVAVITRADPDCSTTAREVTEISVVPSARDATGAPAG